MQLDDTPVGTAIDAKELENLIELKECSLALGSWVSASLSELRKGHDGSYERAAEDFLEALLPWMK